MTMVFFILRRILFAIPIALGVSILCFLLLHISPGDPLSAVLPPDASPLIIAQLREQYGFDKPLPVQFLKWSWRVAHCVLGVAISTSRPVLDEILAALAYTIPLAAVAGLIGFGLGFVLGLIAGYNQGHPIDRIASIVGITGVSIPNYWFGMVLVAVFAIFLPWFPALGAGDPMWSTDYLHHLILPAIAMALVPMGMLVRTLRAIVADILGQEYVEALRAKGMPERSILMHVVKNAMPTVIAVIGIQFGYLLAGSVLVETVFSWPGSGLLLYSAIFSRDLPLLQGTVLTLALSFVTLNLIADVLQVIVNPRMKRA